MKMVWNKGLNKETDKRMRKVSDSVIEYQKKYGNPMQGRRHNKKTKRKISKKMKGKIGKLNGHWKGNNIKYAGLHSWVRKELGQPMKCVECKKIIKDKRKINWANISGKYKRNLKDWKRLCTKCHVLFDKKHMRKNEVIKFENWYKYNKNQWLSDMRRALIDIETNNGENITDILEDYLEPSITVDEGIKKIYNKLKNKTK